MDRNVQAVLFDLDGNLIFHDVRQFLRGYFDAISAYVAERGVDAEKFLQSISYGTKKMVANDGTQINRDVFWNAFFELYGDYDENVIISSDEYYKTEMAKLRSLVTPNEYAKQAVELARARGMKTVLATNPVFPISAQIERLSWSGLSPEDFDLITSYENSRFCKPNPKYYLEICEKIGVEPQNAFMIGNDEREDMKGASEAGLDAFLTTDCRIIAKDYFWTGKRGSFQQVLKVIEII